MALSGYSELRSLYGPRVDSPRFHITFISSLSEFQEPPSVGCAHAITAQPLSVAN
jgi:hypothetical protein